MSVETIAVSMNSSNELVCTDAGDYRGEHNAQMLEITLNEEFASNSYTYHKLAFDTGGLSGKSTSDEITESQDAPIYRSGNKIYCTLAQSLTASGTLLIQLSAYGESDGAVSCIKKSGILKLEFKPSIQPAQIAPDTEALLIEKIGAAVIGIDRLSAQIAMLSHDTVTAGDYLTLEDGVLSANAATTVNMPGEWLATCDAVKLYCDDLMAHGIADLSPVMCAAVTARLVNSMDSNCIGVFVNHGLWVINDAETSGLLYLMLDGGDYLNKYFLIVPTTDTGEAVLFLTTQDYCAGSIYKVTADIANQTEVVTRYQESGFAQLLGLGV